ncbi:MAG: hypothetical protein H6674_10785 [Dehalococcoidia bacterium]|nr:hypothetical protein [Dehalococcoidia bacterium]
MEYMENCPRDILEYSLADLDPGAYTVVHRRASAPVGQMIANPPDSWPVFEGEEALTAIVLLDISSVPVDAGVTDAAP